MHGFHATDQAATDSRRPSDPSGLLSTARDITAGVIRTAMQLHTPAQALV